MTVFSVDLIPSFAAIGLVFLSAALILCFVRLWIGPSLPDRVVALDSVATLLVGLLVLNGIANRDMESLRVATVLALINFVGTIGFAYYLGRSASQ